MTPTFTTLEKEALKLLIKFGWGHDLGGDYQSARRLVIKALKLSDERPVDTAKRRAELKAFLSSP